MQAVPEAKAHDISFNEGVLRLAAVHGRKVTFRYVKDASLNIETREFTPEGVYLNKKGDTLIVGPDEDRGGIRSYRLDRIKGEVQFA